MDKPLARTVPDLLTELADRQPDHDAVVGAEQRLTYRAFQDQVRAFAKGLHRLGVGPGDRVAILMGNRPEWLIADFAAMCLGAVAVGLNTWSSSLELAYQLGHARVAVLVASRAWRERDFADLIAGIEAAGERPESLRHIIAVDAASPADWLPFASVMAAGAAVPDTEIERMASAVRPSDVACLLYTSGSTGLPKGVQLCHGGLIENGFDIGARQRLGPDDRLWLAVSLFWSLASVNAVFALMTHGGAMVLQHDFEAGEALGLIESERCTVIYAMPAMTLALAEHPDRPMRNLTSLRTGVTIGTPEQIRRLVDLGAREVCNVYGLTEAYGNSTVCDARDPLDVRLATCGRPLDGVTLKIVDPETGRRVAPGGIGQIALKGHPMPGYLDDPVRTAEAFDGEGFLLTGDLGLVDGHGRLIFRGRLKELVKTGGINVAPAEVEQVLAQHPAVESAFVTGVPDAKLDEAVAAAIVLKPGMSARPEDLTALCRAALAAYKRPRHYRFISASDLPLTTTGKLQRSRLFELFRRGGEG